MWSLRVQCEPGLTLLMPSQQWEQQQFKRSRRFLLRVRRSLGGSSALYRQLVSLLQRSSAPSSQDLHQVSPDWPRPTSTDLLDLVCAAGLDR